MSIWPEASATIKGWCPGALRPMESGDGLIVRLRIGGGIVETRLAADVARWSRRWGNGQIDLSSRGNLQLRGLSTHHLPALHDALDAWGLLDNDAAGEAVRNVISNPLAGLDPAAVLDVRPIAEGLARRLAADAGLHGLPGKFGFVIDDGGLFGLDEVPSDIRFVAYRTSDGPAFEIHLAGAPHDRLGPCHADAVADVAATLSRMFLDFRNGRERVIRRMRDLVAARSVETIAHEAGLAMPPNCESLLHQHGHPAFHRSPPRHPPSSCRHGPARPGHPSRHPAGTGALTGALARPDKLGHGDALANHGNSLLGNGASLAASHWTAPTRQSHPTNFLGAQPLGPAAFFGVGLPFGRIAAEHLAELASVAAANGAPELRLTPWRAILVPLPSIAAAHAISIELRGDHFIIDPQDPRRRIAACPGASSCARGTTPTRDDAATLATEIAGAPGAGILVHVSGCDKGCADPQPAPITLVAQNGHYHLVCNGMPSDPPVLRDLTLAQAVEQIRQLIPAMPVHE
jgi:precorrin-3B synthase